MEEVLDRGAFAQELWVGGDVDLEVRALVAEQALQLAAGADGDGGFGDDQRPLLQMGRDLLGGGEDIGEVGMAVAAAGGCADGDEDGFGVAHGLGQARREGEPAAGMVALDQGLEAGLVDRDPALAEHGDLALVLVDADHVEPELGKAGAGDEPDIARADHRDSHGRELLRTQVG